MSRAAVQWVRNVPQRDGGRMTDGQLDGRTQRCEELSGKGGAVERGSVGRDRCWGRVASRASAA
jgi:hypothetical protein